MRNRTVRIKHLRAQRAVNDFMRMPTRVFTGSIDYREINKDALSLGRIWAVPEHCSIDAELRFQDMREGAELSEELTTKLARITKENQ